MPTLTTKRIIMSTAPLPFDRYKYEMQFAYSIDSQLLSSYTGNIIEVIEDGGGTTQEFKPSSTLQTEILSFVGANNGYIVGIYDQISGIKTTISIGSQQIQIVNAGVYVNITNKYSLEIPRYTSLTISGIAACNRMKSLSLANYIAFKGEKSIDNYTNDYVFPIKCSAGLMDFSITNGTNVFWYNADGGTSTADKPSSTLINAGNTYLFATNMRGNINIISNTTNDRFIGDLKDLPSLTYSLDLNSCSLITGSLADLQGNIAYSLDLNSCSLITGSLADLQGKITYYLNLNNCSLITGSLADLQGNIAYSLNLNNCSLITGSLADLQGNIAYYLDLGNCGLITGSLADLQGKITRLLNLNNCSLITGSLADLQGKITRLLNLNNCSLITGSLADLQGKNTYSLDLGNCSLITGSLADLQGNIARLLNLNNCSLITGSLADLQGKNTYYLDLGNCSLITGSLADLQGNIARLLNLNNCGLITGVYTPVSTGTPTAFNLSSSGLSATNVDNTLIACYNNPKSEVTFTWTGLTRTSASNTAATALYTTYNWRFNPAL